MEINKLIEELSEEIDTNFDDRCDLSDIGNSIGIVIGKYINDKDMGFDLDSFIFGVKHGVSLIDGTHDKIN